jgi:hypothetical protein
LKECANILCYPLSKLFNISLETGVFPSAWKTAKVIPVFKKGNRTDPANYRPVALLSLVSKIMERYLAHRIVKHLESNGILRECQFGFRSGHSTLHPLLIIHQLAADALDRSQELCISALDIAGAFDTVWHKRLLQKCQAVGITGKVHTLLEDYLKGRHQLVTVNQATSAALPVTAGVPQGSILGPILFLLYINDLPDVVQSMPLIFADDCTLIQRVPNASSRESKVAALQADLNRVTDWASLNQMTFAPHKTQIMTVSRRKDREALDNLPVTMSGVQLQKTSCLKLLGVKFSEDGSVKEHLIDKASTAGKLVGMLRRQSRFLSQEAKYRVYAATIRPVLEYGCPVFFNAPKTHLDALDKIQERAAKLFPDLRHKLDSLGLRRCVSGLCQLYHIVEKSAPSALCRSIQPKFIRIARSTRTSDSLNLRSLNIPRSRTVAHQRSFFPRIARLWNKLDNETTFAPSMQVFKRKCASSLRSMSKDNPLDFFQ